jgi:anti-sigma regulatory factor (Ser/Thr protein kinase)
MTPDIPCSDADDERFARNEATADAETVAYLRDELAGWLRRGTAMDETRLCDAVLATNEALANAAEFAYVDGGGAGTMDLQAVRDVARRTITVTVADQGHWRETNALNWQRSRGRGIPLMRRLADSVIIDTSGRGTSVCLRFDDCLAGRATEVGVS